MDWFDINCMLGPTNTDRESSFRTPEALLAEMDRAGIAEALVYAIPARMAHPSDGNARIVEATRGRPRLHPCWVQMGGVCLGVLAAYSVHVQCTIRNATLPCDELPFVRVDDVLGGSLVLEEGHFRVPEGPGLGVKLDMTVVEKYRVA